MQAIAAKTARIATIAKTAALTDDQMRHLVHGTGGSPRRARRAIKLGIAAEIIARYTVAMAQHGLHPKAVDACSKAWVASMAPEAEAESDAQPEIAAPAVKPVKRTTSRKPAARKAKADPAKLAALLAD